MRGRVPLFRILPLQLARKPDCSVLALDRALAPPSVLDLALAALLATDRRAGQQWDGARASTRPRALRAVSEVGVRHMDGVGAEPRAVRALEAWLRPPLIPWQPLRQLQETQREIEALQRGDTKSGSAEERAWSSRFSAAGDGVVVVPSEQLSDGRCTVCNTGLWGRAESFVASMQQELPSLERPRWLPRVPRASAHLVANSNEYVPDTPAPSRIRHEKGTASNENPRLEPEPEPRLAPTGNNRSKLHFHTMPGSWEMKRWGAAPEGYCWCAPRSRHTMIVC